MKRVEYWTEKGFIKIARIYKSDRLKQGVDVDFYVDKKQFKDTPGVYLLTFKGEILKVGQSANLLNRINIQYKSIVNLGNNRIRKSIKEKYTSVDVYAFKTPIQKFSLLDYNFPINYQKGLEEAILHDFYNKVEDIPVLNLQRN